MATQIEQIMPISSFSKQDNFYDKVEQEMCLKLNQQKIILPKIKSPLRYPGGKSKALKKIMPLILNDFQEFREPMAGGGSVFPALKQNFPNKKFWINDINRELFLFWRVLQAKPQELVKKLFWINENKQDGKRRYIKFNGEVKSLS